MYESLGFSVDKNFHKPDINADVAIVAKGETTFELFEFHKMDHPQVEFIRNHIAIYSDSIEEDVDALLQKGYRLTIPITQGVIFRFAYLQDQAGTNYEIATSKS
jgi:hypothetical protein